MNFQKKLSLLLVIGLIFSFLCFPAANYASGTISAISGTISLPEGELAPVGGLQVDVNVFNETSGFIISVHSYCITEGENSVQYSISVPVNTSGYKIFYGISSVQSKYVSFSYYSSAEGMAGYSSASSIYVSAGDVQGINLKLFTAKMISGKISLPADELAPSGGLQISVNVYDRLLGGIGGSSCVLQEGENSVQYSVPVPVNSNGYRVEYLISTNQSKYVSHAYYSASGSIAVYEAATYVSVSAGNVQDIDLTLLEGKTISGTISLPAGKLAPSGGFQISVNASDENSLFGNGQFYNLPEGTSIVQYSVTVPASTSGYIVSYNITNEQSEYERMAFYSETGSTIKYAVATRVNVSDENIQGIDLTLIAGYTTVEAVLNPADGKATAVLTKALLDEAFLKAGITDEEPKIVNIKIPEVQGSAEYETVLPASFLSSGGENQTIKIITKNGLISIPGNILSTYPVAGDSSVSIILGKADTSGLSDVLKAAVGNRPVAEISMSIDGKTVLWNNNDTPITVMIPYTPAAEEFANLEHITIWYIDGSGNVVPVTSGKYEAATGMVSFSATHSGTFAVTSVHKTFTDLTKFGWAKKQIEVLASKGIISGASAAAYSPEASITRADFMSLLIRTLGLTADITDNFKDISKSDYYYKAVATAKALGITDGAGDNLFKPNDAIIRQDMMVMTVRALKIAGKIDASGTNTDLNKFTDKSKISGYAVSSVATMVKEGIILGSDGLINPVGITSRAEVAIILYRIYNK